MTKEEALWVAIRLVGLVFLALSIIYFAKLALVSVYYFYITDFAIFYNSVSEISNGEEIARKSVQKIFLEHLIHVTVFVIAAFYFLRKGKLVHRIISK